MFFESESSSLPFFYKIQLTKLGSEYEKIRDLWSKYKKKVLTGKQFTKNASKLLGEKFVNIFGDIRK